MSYLIGRCHQPWKNQGQYIRTWSSQGTNTYLVTQIAIGESNVLTCLIISNCDSLCRSDSGPCQGKLSPAAAGRPQRDCSQDMSQLILMGPFLPQFSLGTRESGKVSFRFRSKYGKIVFRLNSTVIELLMYIIFSRLGNCLAYSLAVRLGSFFGFSPFQ